MTAHQVKLLPSDDLPDGTVKVPLGLPRGAAWPLVAQIAALSQRAAGCTASIGYLAERLGMHPATVYDALDQAGAWIVTNTNTRTTRRYLAPIPDDAAWARISYRAAAGVGCHSVGGQWTVRRNRSLLLELYCRLRRDETIGIARDQRDLAQAMGVTDRTVRALIVILESDGWISKRRSGRRFAYLTHDAPLRVVSAEPTLAEEECVSEMGAVMEQAPERSRKLTRNDLGRSGETISEAQATQKQELEAGLLKREYPPLAVGDLQHRKRADHEALRERPQPGSDSNEQATAEPQVFFVGREPFLVEVPDLAASGPPVCSSVRVLGAPSVMSAIPLDWQVRMSEADRERVMVVIEAEMAAGRSVAEMTARVRRRLAVWRGRQVRRPVAAALVVVRRGYDCPRPECEDHMLPSGSWCGACAEIGARVNRERLAAVVGAGSAPVSPPGWETAPPPPQRVRPASKTLGADATSSPRAVQAIAQARAELAALRGRSA